MQVKRFYKPSVREAVEAARDALGPEALVLSTEMVAAPGWRGWFGRRGVALTAAVERLDQSPEPFDRSAIERALAERRFDRLVSDDRTPAPVERHSREERARAGVVACFAAAGVDSALAQAAVARLSAAECRGLSATRMQHVLAAELATLVATDDDFAPYEVFVGPPGVGKTTTIAKIAARERVMHGRTLDMVSADAYRAGAIEHLRAYANVIGAPFRIARSASELSEALDASRHAVLVDTAGRSPSDDSVQQLLATLDRKRGVRTHLVLAADTTARTARRLLDRYAPTHPSRVIITKLDEAESAAPLVGVIRDHGLQVSYVAAGQRIPEDLDRATPAWLASVMLNHAGEEGQSCH